VQAERNTKELDELTAHVWSRPLTQATFIKSEAGV
jgi:hypothetical protein